MFVRAKKKAENRWQVQVVESQKVAGKTRQKIVRNVGTAHNEIELADFKAIGENIIVDIKNKLNPVLGFVDPKDVYAPKKRKNTLELVNLKSLKEEKRVNVGFEKVMKPLFDDYGVKFDDEKTTEVIQALTMARAFKPSSKLESKRILGKYFDIDIPLHDIYRSIDKLADNEDYVKKLVAKKTFDLFRQEVDIMFFDVTTLSFETQKQDELRDFGFSKDCKFNEVQVVLAMVTTREGMPITYKLFPGNTFEGGTLIPIIEELKKEYLVKKVFLAADRGMFSEANLAKMDEQGIEYVVAAKLKTMKKAIKDQILSPDSYPAVVKNEFIWMKELEHNKRRLIISYSSKRAKKDSADRQRLVDRLMKKVKDGKIKIKDLISNHGTKKYIKTDGKSTATVDLVKLSEDSCWDGIYGYITNSTITASEVIERYRGLWQIEESFRINKSTLKMRPIFHWSPKRIRGHICLCFITYALVRRIQFQLKNAGSSLSINQFLEAMTDIQASELVNQRTKKKYLLPSKLTSEAEELVKALDLKYSYSLTPISS